MTDLEILIAAKAKIADPKNWTQGSFARTSQGISVFPLDKSAICYCALGALYSVCGTETTPVEILLDRASYMFNPGYTNYIGAAYINDTQDHATVMAMYDRAIEIAKRKYTSHAD